MAISAATNRVFFWCRRLALVAAQWRLEQLKRKALRACIDGDRAAAIDQARAVILRLEWFGFIGPDQRIRLCQDWIRDFTRCYLPQLYRARDTSDVRRWGQFLIR